jgi:hypothetical protein
MRVFQKGDGEMPCLFELFGNDFYLERFLGKEIQIARSAVAKMERKRCTACQISARKKARLT